jgi:hypothetical protein
VLDGTQFGKAHTLYVNRFGDIEKYANMPVGEGELPTGWREKPYVEKVSEYDLCEFGYIRDVRLPVFRTTFVAGWATPLDGTSTSRSGTRTSTCSGTAGTAMLSPFAVPTASRSRTR